MVHAHYVTIAVLEVTCNIGSMAKEVYRCFCGSKKAEEATFLIGKSVHVASFAWQMSMHSLACYSCR